MVQFDEIKKQIYLKKINKIEKKIDKEQGKKSKIFDKYNLKQYKDNNYCYIHLVDRKKFWQMMLKENCKDFVKVLAVSAAGVTVCSVPFVLIGNYENAVKFFLLFGSFGVSGSAVLVVNSGIAYNGHRRQVSRVENYLKGTYRPINRCDNKIKDLNQKKESTNKLLNELQSEDMMMAR